MRTREGEIFNEELRDPSPVMARPTGKLLAVGTVGACPCGCGRPAGVILDTPMGAVVMTTWAEAEAAIRAIEASAVEQWGERP